MANILMSIDQGALQGRLVTDIKGSQYCSFRGIPYAKPPIRNLRFKAPEPLEKWTGVLDATKEGNACYARDALTKLIVGSEDCLILNVFTKQLPKGPQEQLKPVMFWIHGGGFTCGSSSIQMFGPDFLITEDLVIVSLNYRLGMLGFLSLKDSSLEVPGNAGLKDMVMALKWVQKNIRQFGGDPNNVTIFGHSSGATSVYLLVLSSMAKGLFHRAIAQSGSVIDPWEEEKIWVQVISKAIGRNTVDEQSLLKYLIELPVEEVLEIQEKLGKEFNPNSLRPFGPVVEDAKAKEIFLSQNPIDIILAGKFNSVPFMTGYTTAEGLLYKLLKDVEKLKGENFEIFVHPQLGYKIGSAGSKEVAARIKKYYFGDEVTSVAQLDKFYALISDATFMYGIQVAARKLAFTSTAPVYLYRVSLESSLNLFKTFGQIKEPGTCHGDELGYLFKNFATPTLESGSIEDVSVQRFVRLWANFARYGNPIPNKEDPLLNVIWKSIQKNASHFLNIGKDLVMGTEPDLERMNFWEDIYKNSPGGKKFVP